MKKKHKPTIEELIEEEYLIHNEEEDDEMFWLKESLKNALNNLERKIFITYLEQGSYRQTAKLFKVTTPTVSKYINNLKTKLLEYACTKYTDKPTDNKPDNDPDTL